MYDELIQAEIDRLNVSPPITISPSTLPSVLENFHSENPKSVILTGTAGDGKTYHCRLVFEELSENPELWQQGLKYVSLPLKESNKTLNIVKDLSELSHDDKSRFLPSLMASIADQSHEEVFLVAANDGQLLATLREWSESQGDVEYQAFKLIEGMLVADEEESDRLSLRLHNLSRLDAAEHFLEIINQLIEHRQWDKCKGCELLNEDGTSTCPIRINRERLCKVDGVSLFQSRLADLLKLSRANHTHLPIRDLLLLGVNILLGDRASAGLLTCRMAQNRAAKGQYKDTNPYTNVFGSNLPERQRQQYQAFTALDAFGIGRETDNKIDNLLIYGSYNDEQLFNSLIGNDVHYGAEAYASLLRDYLEGEREEITEFMRALARQRQRLFFTIPENGELRPWSLSVYRSADHFLSFGRKLAEESEYTRISEQLVKGLNRTFCGMMIDDDTKLFIASSGGDGRGRIASILEHELGVTPHRRDPYLRFVLGHDRLTPNIEIVDPAGAVETVIDGLELQLTHFEYLMRVARGSLPASFSRQCYEDFLDFKLRLIERLDQVIGSHPIAGEVNLQAITVDARGRPQPDNIRIRVGDK
ncbi:hypothetical protein [uncultured Cohaesibacter sp.]|uniref:hypothetical protein n=1 Tax=uncultured Cohaesibacter sp. TaxID=1002546 RepID=UPI0029C8CADA|nr:hypothetical protein [uncultured Cohaesibacter sp.]